jgi:hypothetical protein
LDPFESLLNKAGKEDLKRFVVKVAHNNPNIEKNSKSSDWSSQYHLQQAHGSAEIKNQVVQLKKLGSTFRSKKAHGTI